MESTIALPRAEAVRRTTVDRGLLLDRTTELTADELAAPFVVEGGPMGDFCDSLHDLVAHVLMWDEYNLAVLTEARAGRAHWTLDPRWETREAGRMLNLAGVVAGRELPADLLLHRFTTVHDAMLRELSAYDETAWTAATSLSSAGAESIGALAQYVMTVPGHSAYWHAALHLGELARVGA